MDPIDVFGGGGQRVGMIHKSNLGCLAGEVTKWFHISTRFNIDSVIMKSFFFQAQEGLLTSVTAGLGALQTPKAAPPHTQLL